VACVNVGRSTTKIIVVYLKASTPALLLWWTTAHVFLPKSPRLHSLMK